MKAKRDFPVEKIRELLEPGPVVLLSSAYRDERDIMTMGWHTVMEFSPSLVGCVIASSNHSFNLIRKSRECVINIPDASLMNTVIGIGNCSGAEWDKFTRFGLTPREASRVRAPLVKQCFANLECTIHDEALVNRYNFFIFKVVKAHLVPSRKPPETLHYKGRGRFMLSGETLNRARRFTALKGQPNF